MPGGDGEVVIDRAAFPLSGGAGQSSAELRGSGLRQMQRL
jgi:hypothetical protein